MQANVIHNNQQSRSQLQLDYMVGNINYRTWHIGMISHHEALNFLSRETGKKEMHFCGCYVNRK